MSVTSALVLEKASFKSLFKKILCIISPVARNIKAKEEAKLKAEKVLNDYGNSILRMAYSYLHNIQDAEDILQNTLIRYIKAEKEFDSEAYEKAWLLKVASNLSKNKLKYNKVRNYTELDETIPAPEKNDLAFVWEAVKNLPEKYSEVIHLYYYEGYSSIEVAQILEKNQATVRSLLKRGRDLLKTQLKEAYDFEI